ncbi:MAG: helix-hairpin-helix domain-containing protein [Thermoanaerobaculia bacterium]
MNGATLYDQEGRPVRLGSELGKGGEGSVFAVAGAPKLAAKVYHEPVAPQKAKKLAAMVHQQSEGLLEVAAWPVGTLSRAPGARPVGLLMPKVSGFKPVHLLYGPKSRLAEFPRATWAFLLHAAGNLARALAVLHTGGNVVGDINHGNVLVSSRGVIKLIDCDSFQIQAGERRYLCEVGVPTHTAPELQGRNLRTVARTPNHDAFGLAVVIFQLLFLGRHPFSGTYLGRGDMPLEQAIRELRFAYGRAAATRKMKPPPHTPTLAVASPQVAALFERAFSPGSAQEGVRPLPREWVEILESLPLRACERRKVHVFADALESCPWCPIEVTTGTLLFKGADVETAVQDAFDVAAAWRDIQAVPPPVPPAQLLSDPRPAAYYSSVLRGGVKKIFFLTLTFLVGLALLTTPESLVFGVPLTLPIGPAALVCLVKLIAAARAQRKLEKIREDWHPSPVDNSFEVLLRSLDNAVKAHLDLPALWKRRTTELTEGLRKRQLEQYLDSHRIDSSGLEGLTPGVLATLQSHGIETAADAMAMSLLKVPALAQGLIDRLREWRRTLEEGFVFDASRGIDADDLIAVSETLGKVRKALEQELLSGPDRLRKMADSLLHRRNDLLPRLTEAQIVRDEAMEDLRKFLS